MESDKIRVLMKLLKKLDDNWLCCYVLHNHRMQAQEGGQYNVDYDNFTYGIECCVRIWSVRNAFRC